MALTIYLMNGDENEAIITCDDKLMLYQCLVGGCIEILNLPEGQLIMNEEAHLYGLPPNVKASQTFGSARIPDFYGTVLFVTDEDILD